MLKKSEFSKSILCVKNHLYYIKHTFFYSFCEVYFAKFKLLFLKLCPIFVGPAMSNTQNTAISLKVIQTNFDATPQST